MNRQLIIDKLNTFLQTSDFQDYCVNGLQVEGTSTVCRAVTGVSASRRLFEEAVTRGAQLVVVHHGLFWKGGPHPFHLTGIMMERIRTLLCNGINLAVYHLPLDAHPEIGNNAMLLKTLGMERTEPFDVGFISRLKTPLQPGDLQKRLDALLPDPCRMYGDTAGTIASIAVVSGGGASLLEKAGRLGIDAFITGEPSEPSVRSAEEWGVCFLSTGHYNSERFGPIALAEAIRSMFGIPCDFVDVPNAV
ncbi:Nif3-like dinuclear metal center hexameric protein [bacterium]|nr:Nif3-like dinuclear metal center hexameric protein [candidate division CSSED10-310 bacterium]